MKRMIVLVAAAACLSAVPALNALTREEAQLFKWVRLGQVEGVTKTIAQVGPDINARDNYGYTPLMYAAQLGYTMIAEILLSKGADINYDERGQSALTLAVQSGKADMVTFLLNRGARCEPNRCLQLAAVSGDSAIIGKILDRGANIDGADPAGRTPLMLAAMYGRQDAVTFLLSKGARATARDNHGSTARDYALKNGKTEAAALFKDGTATVPRDELSAQAIEAAEKGDKARMQSLLAQGADVNARNAAGHTLLIIAIRNDRQDLARFLIAQGADTTLKDNRGLTAEQWSQARGYASAIPALRKTRPEDPVDTAQLLFSAISKGDRSTVESLINGGAPVDATDTGGKTLLMAAAEKGDSAIARLLLDHGAAVGKKDDYGATALMYCARNRMGAAPELVQMFYNRGADIFMRDNSGRTALWYADYYGNADMKQSLQNFGLSQ